MLDEFLKVAYVKVAARQQGDDLVSMMRQLPEAELHKIARDGQIKSAFHADCGMEWVENFRGTPLFEAAIQIEQEAIQAEVAQQQSSAIKRQNYAAEDAERDQLRLKRRLLELQLMQSEASSVGAAPPTADTAPSMPAPSGANAPKTDAKVAAQHRNRVGAHNVDEQADEQGAGAVATPIDKGDKVAECFKQAALNMGMLKGVGQAAWGLAKKHPGAAIGAGLGVAHGLMKPDGGIGSALGEGALGAAAGHGAQTFAQTPSVAKKFKQWTAG